MPLARRIIPCLDIDGGRVVKGVRFVNLRDAGDPVEVARRYNRDGADEIVFLDITATSDEREILRDIVARVAEEITIPLTVGGGVRSTADFCALLHSGADKVGINSAAVARPELLGECARQFGAQCVVLAADVRRIDSKTDSESEIGSKTISEFNSEINSENGGGKWEVVTHGGRRPTGLDALEWLRRAESEGAGEILLTSMDADGTRDGYDIPLLRAATSAVRIPIIASGGGGEPAHLAAAFLDGGADAALAAGIFHDGVFTIGEVKSYLAAQGIPIRAVLNERTAA